MGLESVLEMAPECGLGVVLDESWELPTAHVEHPCMKSSLLAPSYALCLRHVVALHFELELEKVNDALLAISAIGFSTHFVAGLPGALISVPLGPGCS